MEEWKRLVSEDAVLGIAHFPTVLHGEFAQMYPMIVTTVAPRAFESGQLEFTEMRPAAVGGVPWIACVDKRLLSVSADTTCSIMSAVTVALDVFWVEDQRRKKGIGARTTSLRPGTRRYLWIGAPPNVRICGASEGLAALLALLCFRLPSNVACTGFVAMLGEPNSVAVAQNLVKLPIESVDGVPIKCRGAVERGFFLIAPAQDVPNDLLSELNKARPGGNGVHQPYLQGQVAPIVPVSKFGDVLRAVHALGAETHAAAPGISDGVN